MLVVVVVDFRDRIIPRLGRRMVLGPDIKPSRRRRHRHDAAHTHTHTHSYSHPRIHPHSRSRTGSGLMLFTLCPALPRPAQPSPAVMPCHAMQVLPHPAYYGRRRATCERCVDMHLSGVSGRTRALGRRGEGGRLFGGYHIGDFWESGGSAGSFSAVRPPKPGWWYGGKEVWGGGG